MAQPTQVLPSWLTLSTTVITLPDGSIETSSTTLQLPLTYYGPSIPLGTDGVWVYGGLTSPPSTTSATPTSSTATPTSTPTLTSTLTSLPTSSSSSMSSSASSSAASSTSSTSSASSTSAAPTAVAGSSHGISPSTLGAILGSILGTLLLLILIAIVFLLRQNRQRKAPTDGQQPSSSFWNRSTTLMTLRHSQVPIWTGWELVSPEDGQSGPPSPGEGSPRGSGEEDDPFLTRRSVHSSTDMGHTRTDTDTLVSLPAIARTGTVSSHRTAPKHDRHIIPREVQMRLDEELSGDVPPYPSIRMVERRPSTDQQIPLLPPRPLDPDSLGVAQRRPASNPSLGSEKSKLTDNARSIMSKESDGTDVHEPEGAELLTARRVKVGQIQSRADPGASSSEATPSVLGLDRLANLGRMSWFRRMSFLGAPAGSQPVARNEQEAESDSYTRTPPRHSRNGSRSRPGSFAARISAHEPTADSFGRRLRTDSGIMLAGSRPISSVSAHSAASGNTVFYDAQSRPGSSMGSRSTGGSGSTPVPPVPQIPSPHYVQPSPLSREVRQDSGSPDSVYSEDHLASENPPTYETATAPHSQTGRQYSDIDVLDMPVPRPASPFSAASGSRGLPPGLIELPNPTAWRNSHASSSPTPGTDVTSGISVDVLEEAPPPADNHWLNIAGGLRPTDGRRTTFGVPVVVEPRDVLQSERGSLHSTRSHLSPFSSRSPSGSAAASSRHTMSGSGSSRPSASGHSRGPTGGSSSLNHSSSVSFDDYRPSRHRAEVGEVASPPISAVFPGRGFPSSGTGSPPLSVSPSYGDEGVLPAPVLHPVPSASQPIPVPAPAATRFGLGSGTDIATGTMTSSDTRGTADESLTDSSVTTTQTDPITGAVVHFPRLPWRSGHERAWGERPLREDAMW